MIHAVYVAFKCLGYDTEPEALLWTVMDEVIGNIDQYAPFCHLIGEMEEFVRTGRSRSNFCRFGIFCIV